MHWHNFRDLKSDDRCADENLAPRHRIDITTDNPIGDAKNACGDKAGKVELDEGLGVQVEEGWNRDSKYMALDGEL
jgi:hypothetical protein